MRGAGLDPTQATYRTLVVAYARTQQCLGEFGAVNLGDQSTFEMAEGPPSNISVVHAEKPPGLCEPSSACFAHLNALKLLALRDSPYDLTLLLDTDVFAQPTLPIAPAQLLDKLQLGWQSLPPADPRRHEGAPLCIQTWSTPMHFAF